MKTFQRAAIALCMICLATAQVRSEPDFYRGKTVRVIIPTAVGGSYGVFGQLVSRHLGRFISGQPAMVMTAMPGAGGLVALNHMATIAPHDGTVISVIQVTLVLDSLFNKDAKFDARDFNWIGRMDSLAFVGLASRRSGIKSLDDARKREVIAGSPGLNNVPAQTPLLLNRLAGTKFKLISGYSGIGQAFLAVERGEADFAVSSLAGIGSILSEQVKNGDLVPIVAQSTKRIPAYPDVPVLGEFAKTEVEKAFLKVFSLTADIGRALAATPGVPEDRMAILRDAFEKMVADRAFQADATKIGLDLNPMNAEELARLVRDAMNMSPDLREQVRKFYEDVLEGKK